MLDPDEFADYEAWKENKLTSQTDLSVRAYNAEMESLALAWEAGVRESINVSDIQKINSTLDRNPYRGKGMRGERRGSDAELPRVSRNTPPIEEDPEEDKW
jgi:hypothetical protein